MIILKYSLYYLIIIFSGTGETQECKTVAGPKINHRCIFPFVFDGKTYKTCVYDMLGPGHLDIWCPTKVDSKGNYIEGQDNWGFCGSACLTGKKSKFILKL